MSDFVRPQDGSSPGSPVPGILQARTLDWKSVAQSCPTLSDPMDYSLTGSSIHGIFQARVLEWGAIAFSNQEVNNHYLKCLHFDSSSSHENDPTPDHPTVYYLKGQRGLTRPLLQNCGQPLSCLFNVCVMLVMKYF